MTQDQPFPDSTDRPRPQDRPGAAKAGKAEAASQAMCEEKCDQAKASG